MKNLKRNITLVLLFAGTVLFAQRFGLQSTGALTGLQQSTATADGDFNVLSGALFGPEIEFMVAPKYSIEAAALFELRAGRYDISWYKPDYTYTRILYYAQVPVHLTYRQSVNKNANVLYFAGPRLNIGLFGNTNEHYTLASITQISDESCFGEGNAMNRMDLAFDLGVGFEVKRFQFKLNYSLPLTNSANVSDLMDLKQHQLQLAVGVTLHKFKAKKDKDSKEAKPAERK